MEGPELRRRLGEIRDSLAAHRPASLRVEAEGTVYTRTFLPGERLILLGAGHVARALCPLAAGLGFSVTVADDRPDFVCRDRFPQAEELVCSSFPAALDTLSPGEGDYVAILTRGHRHDGDCLRRLLRGPLPRYLGLMGSARRLAGLFARLEQEGFPREALEQVHGPIGVPIGAVTVEEIALSIAAQLVLCRRSGLERPPGASHLPLETADPGLLDFLTSPGPRAMLLVCETEGSTPAPAGSLMGVDAAFATRGTIGGGCAEAAALREAHRLLGTGEGRLLHLDLDLEGTGEAGMACGGRITVLLQDLS